MKSAQASVAIDDALTTARRVVGIIEGLRSVSTLPACDDPLGDTPREVVMGQLCVAAAETSNQMLGEVQMILRLVNGKTDA